HEALLRARRRDVERAHTLGLGHAPLLRLEPVEAGARRAEEAQLERPAAARRPRGHGLAGLAAPALVQLHRGDAAEVEALRAVVLHPLPRVLGGLARAALLAALLGGDRAVERAQAAAGAAVRRERLGELAEEAVEVGRAPGPEVSRALDRL